MESFKRKIGGGYLLRLLAIVLLTSHVCDSYAENNTSLSSEVSLGRHLLDFGFLPSRQSGVVARLTAIGSNSNYFISGSIESIINEPEFTRSFVKGIVRRYDLDFSVGRSFADMLGKKYFEVSRWNLYSGIKYGQISLEYLDDYEIKFVESGIFFGGGYSVLFGNFTHILSINVGYGYFFDSRLETRNSANQDINIAGVVDGISFQAKLARLISKSLSVNLSLRRVNYDFQNSDADSIGGVRERGTVLSLGIRYAN